MIRAVRAGSVARMEEEGARWPPGLQNGNGGLPRVATGYALLESRGFFFVDVTADHPTLAGSGHRVGTPDAFMRRRREGVGGFPIGISAFSRIPEDGLRPFLPSLPIVPLKVAQKSAQRESSLGRLRDSGDAIWLRRATLSTEACIGIQLLSGAA
jgi:hypothetical protein